jgi:hypothetical protein
MCRSFLYGNREVPRPTGCAHNVRCSGPHREGADPRIIRLIQKWLKAGVLEDGVVTVSEKGTGQGSVITPRTQKITLNLS